MKPFSLSLTHNILIPFHHQCCTIWYHYVCVYIELIHFYTDWQIGCDVCGSTFNQDRHKRGVFTLHTLNEFFMTSTKLPNISFLSCIITYIFLTHQNIVECMCTWMPWSKWGNVPQLVGDNERQEVGHQKIVYTESNFFREVKLKLMYKHKTQVEKFPPSCHV